MMLKLAIRVLHDYLLGGIRIEDIKEKNEEALLTFS